MPEVSRRVRGMALAWVRGKLTSSVPQPRVPYGRLINVDAAFGNAPWDRIATLAPERQVAAGNVYRALTEYHSRLHFRFLDLLAAEAEVAYLPTPPDGYTLQEAQMRFVDDFEAFHQHIYATLSSLAHLLTRLVPPGRDVPTRSVKDFLVYLAKYLPKSADEIARLEVSRDYRARYVDHPQQSPVRDWMTYRTPHADEAYLIYFEHATERAPAPPRPSQLSHDPRNPDFRPPVPASRWFVAPGVRETYAATLHVSKRALGGPLWTTPSG